MNPTRYVVKIGKRLIGENEPCLIIAEAGINHNGDMRKARMLIDVAAECGAEVIKFQTHIPEREMLTDLTTADYLGEPLFDLLKRVELSRKQHVVLKEYAAEKGILFLSTPFSKEAVELLEELGIEAYKIGSGELTNFPLLEYVAKKGKPMIVSTGMSMLEEIEETVNFIGKFNKNLILLHCTSTYPTRYEDVNLRVIDILRKRFNLPVGISDHSVGIYTALAGVALGACVIEKHFTISRDWPGPDQKASITPDELKELVKGVRAIEKALGSTKKITDDELPIQRMARESVVSLIDIPKGTSIKESVVGVKRPGTGIPAKYLDKVIGMRAQKDIKADTTIKWSDLE